MKTQCREASRVAWLAAFLFLVPRAALAGPNASGTLIVHDVHIVQSDSDIPLSPPPASCSEVDNSLPAGDDFWRVWKVYAAFPIGSSPRLKALSWGMGLNTVNGEVATVLAAGLPSIEDFEITYGDWPFTNGSGVAELFAWTQTAQIIECYWFLGYGYSAGMIFSTTPHPVEASVFLDDAMPANEDPVAGYSSLGFGVNGSTVCSDPMGACCQDGPCVMTTAGDCDGPCWEWFGPGIACSPNPCPASMGACCYTDGTCVMRTCTDCEADGGLYSGAGTACEPNPCLPCAAGDSELESVTTLRVAPNPFAGCTTLHLAGRAAAPARIIIFDAAGRIVRVAWEGTLDVREVAVSWDGNDRSGRKAPAGTYLVRVESASGAAAVRLVKMP